ncbi:hypothetical protein [Vibrio harveyi]|uniref:hypothetical protein n=1 Tax=Vibrio harveyi TaxID=669 RepID=UPI00084E973C|nr:hypothetical protein [Vibrio harveyi]
MSNLDDAVRQRYVTNRRKESGLVTKKYHLSQESINKLRTIGRQMGFTETELGKNENLSAIIDDCIEHYLKESLQKRRATKHALYLKQVHRIVKYRENEGYSDKAIMTFLEYWGYEPPMSAELYKQDGVNRIRKFTLKSWSVASVAKLRDEEYVEKQFQLLCRKMKRVIKRKNKGTSEKRTKRESYEDWGYLPM